MSQSEPPGAPGRYFDFDFDLVDDVDLPRLLELGCFFDLPDLLVPEGVEDEELLELDDEELDEDELDGLEEPDAPDGL